MDPEAHAYAARAQEYANHQGTMDAVHPADRRLVDAWADALAGDVLDAGCGPGHWTRHLVARGVPARGIDLVPSFVDLARAAHPGVRYDVGTIDDLGVPGGSLGGILSWFSTIHHTPDGLAVPLGQFARALRPGGSLLLGFFHADGLEQFDHAVLPAYRWPAALLHRRLEAAGFDVEETHLRAVSGERPVGAVIARRSDRPAASSVGITKR